MILLFLTSLFILYLTIIYRIKLVFEWRRMANNQWFEYCSKYQEKVPITIPIEDYYLFMEEAKRFMNLYDTILPSFNKMMFLIIHWSYKSITREYIIQLNKLKESLDAKIDNYVRSGANTN